MKTKMILAVAIVALFLFSSTSISQHPSGDDAPNLKINIKVFSCFKTVFAKWYLINITVKNLEDKKVELCTNSVPGGFNVYVFQFGHWRKIYSAPEAIPMILVNLTLEPNQEAVIYQGTWNMRWHFAIRFYIKGYLRSYEYNGTVYPRMWSEMVSLSRFPSLFPPIYVS